MTISIIQIVVLVFAVFAWSRALLRFKDNKITWREFAFWTIVWAAAVFGAFIPSLLAQLAGIIGIKRPVDTAVYIGIIVLFYLVFRVYVKLEHSQEEITRLVRELALQRVKRKK